ncbi:unnamed protein product [Urochloa humidicola]
MEFLSFRVQPPRHGAPPAAVANEQDQCSEVCTLGCVVQSLVDKLNGLKITSPCATSATASRPPSAGACGPSECSSDEHSVNIVTSGDGVVNGGLCRTEP